MHICDLRKVIYLHNPKCAGMSISRHLEYIGFRFVGDLDWPHNYENADNYSIYLTFTVVRNPWDRFVSWYRYVVQHQHKYDGTLNDFILNLAAGDQQLVLIEQYEYIKRSMVCIPLNKVNEGLKMLGLLSSGRVSSGYNKTVDGGNEGLYDISCAARVQFFQWYRNDYKLLSERGILFDC
jgi:hypothetical protein